MTTSKRKADGEVRPGTGNKPTGGRATDSTHPGAESSAVRGTVSQEVLRGMAPAGQSDSAYQQSYLVCMRQLGF